MCFWGDCYVYLWRLNKVFTSFNGNKMKEFIFNIPSILVFMSNTFKMTEELKSLNDGLWTWYNIVAFFNIVKYDDEDHFKESI